MQTLRWTLQSSERLWRRNATVYLHSWHMKLVPPMLAPVLYLLAFGFGLGKLIGRVQDQPYTSYIAPGIAASVVMFGTSFAATWQVFVKLHFEKLYDAVLGTPLSAREIVIGETLWSITVGIIQGIFFIIVAALFGLTNGWFILLTPLAAAVTALCFATMGITFASLAPNVDWLSFYDSFVLSLTFLLSGVFFPVSFLPSWAQPLAWLSPLYHARSVFRLLFGVAPINVLATSFDVIWLATFGLLLLPLAISRLHTRLIR